MRWILRLWWDWVLDVHPVKPVFSGVTSSSPIMFGCNVTEFVLTNLTFCQCLTIYAWLMWSCVFLCFVASLWGVVSYSGESTGSVSERIYTVDCCDICMKDVQIFVILHCFVFMFVLSGLPIFWINSTRSEWYWRSLELCSKLSQKSYYTGGCFQSNAIDICSHRQ